MKNILISLLALGALSTLAASPLSYTITVDSSSIGALPGFIEFQFNQANGATSLPATASVSNFSSTGFTFNDALNESAGTTGSLSALPLGFDNTAGAANYFDQGVTSFGSGFSFVLTLDGPALDTTADDGSEFFVYLLDPDYKPLSGLVASVAINGDTTVALNAINGVSTIEAYTPPPPSEVPEPAAIWLFASGAVMLVAVRRCWKPSRAGVRQQS